MPGCVPSSPSAKAPKRQSRGKGKKKREPFGSPSGLQLDSVGTPACAESGEWKLIPLREFSRNLPGLFEGNIVPSEKQDSLYGGH